MESPGGSVEEGEAPWEAVIREVLEETGLRVRVQRLQGVYHKRHSREIVFSFLCSVTGGHLTASDEADTHAYFAFCDIPANFSPSQLDRLTDYHEQPTALTMKTQNCIPTRTYPEQLQNGTGPSGRP